MEGWIKIHKKLLQWEWADDPNMMSAWLHILLEANYEDKRWHGIVVPRGSFVTSLSKFAKQVGITIKQVRLVFERLEEAHQVTIKRTSQYSIVSVCNYESYQVTEDAEGTPKDTQEGTPRASEGHAKGNDIRNTASSVIDNVINGLDNSIDNNLNNNININNNTENALLAHASDNTLFDAPEQPHKVSLPKAESVVWVADLYNEICTKLPRCTKLSDKRKVHIRSRLRDAEALAVSEGRTAKEVLTDIFTRLQNNTFYHGNNPRAWKANFEWIMKSEDNFLKVYEGVHDHPNSKPTTAKQPITLSVNDIWK